MNLSLRIQVTTRELLKLLARVGRFALSEFVALTWYGLFPLAVAFMAATFFILVPQGRELLQLVVWEGSTQLFLFCGASVCLLAALHFSASLAMRSLTASVGANELADGDLLVATNRFATILTTAAGAALAVALVLARFGYPPVEAADVAACLWFIAWVVLFAKLVSGTPPKAWVPCVLLGLPAADMLLDLVKVMRGIKLPFLGDLVFIVVPIFLVAGLVLLWLNVRYRFTRWARLLVIGSVLVLDAATESKPWSYFQFWVAAVLCAVSPTSAFLARAGKVLDGTRMGVFIADRRTSCTLVAWSLAALAILFVVGFNTWPATLAPAVGTPALVLSALAVWGTLATILFVHVPSRFGWPPITPYVLLVVVVFSMFNDNHEVRQASAKSDVGSVKERPSVATDFPRWYDTHSEGDPDFPVFLVSASGGGLRAAYWAALSLAKLDERMCGDLGNHIYAISTVSGGGLGAAAYLSARQSVTEDQRRRCRKGDAQAVRIAPAVQGFLMNDYLSPIAGSLLFPEVMQQVFPFPLFNDRARALEQSWELNGKDRLGSDFMSRPFVRTLFTAPHLILNSTRVEDGRRVAITSVKFPLTDAYDLFESLPAYGDMPISAAVHASARFTFVSPAGTLWTSPTKLAPAEPWGRLVDGGYFENSGTASLMDLLTEIQRTWKDAKRSGAPRVVAVLLNNDPTVPNLVCTRAVQSKPWTLFADDRSNDRYVYGEPVQPQSIGPVGGETHDFLPELMSPVEAVLNARESRASFYEKTLAERVAAMTSRPVCENVVEINLGWQKTEKPRVSLFGTPIRSFEPILGWAFSEKSASKLAELAEGASNMFPFRHISDCVDPDANRIRGVLFTYHNSDPDDCPRPTPGGALPRVIGRRNADSLMDIVSNLRRGGMTLITPSQTASIETLARQLAQSGIAVSVVNRSPDLATAEHLFPDASVEWSVESPSASTVDAIFRASVADANRRMAGIKFHASQQVPPPGNRLIIEDRALIARTFDRFGSLADGEIVVLKFSSEGPRYVGRLRLEQWDALPRLEAYSK